MDLLPRLITAALDVAEALPRRASRFVVAAVAAVFLLCPALLLDVGALRAQPIIESVLKAVDHHGSTQVE